jgi:hypothetical protein
LNLPAGIGIAKRKESKFMTDSESTYQERAKRIADAISLKKPDIKKNA